MFKTEHQFYTTFSRKQKSKEDFPIHFMKLIYIILMQKYDKKAQKRENYKPISLKAINKNS